jgi:Xaa-Pro aminopeptidase
MITQEYIDRRDKLKRNLGSGLIFLPGNNLMPMNYPSNTYPFRQDSTFLYFTGIDRTGINLIMDCDSGEEILIGDDHTIEDEIWAGTLESIDSLAQKSGILKCEKTSYLNISIKKALNNKQTVHYLPPYPSERKITLAKLLEKSISEVENGTSMQLIQEVIKLRSLKSKSEIAEIESALNNATGPMHIETIKMAKPARFEYEIAANICKIALENKMNLAYPVICTVHGEILHNDLYGNKLHKGQLLLVDAAAESQLHYASDITRTIPVGGKFSSQQKDIYELVLATQIDSINKLKPGIEFIEIHKSATLNIANGLKEIGLMKGDIKEAVDCGAHALFFPHGLGHMLGLDVHDMEDLGEEYVGYSEGIRRSSQFGTANLRLARKLQSGFVLTIEPGIYFIPALIKQWKEESKFKEFINYNLIARYMDFGGIRIEDNILITQDGNQVLGKPIPKKYSEIENLYSL